MHCGYLTQLHKFVLLTTNAEQKWTTREPWMRHS